MAKLISHAHVNRFSQPFTLAMFEGCADDVATYECKGHVSAEDCLARGSKWTERDNAVDGFPVPEGKHYRR